MKLSDLRVIKAQYTEAIKTHGKELLKEEFKIFFNKVPEVLSIRWRQYTPYFNDGDVCTFSADEFSVQIEKISQEDQENNNSYGDNEDGYLSSYDFTKNEEWQDDIVKNMDSSIKQRISEALEELNENAHDDDILKMTFGDHVIITATREDFEVEEFEHE